MTRRLSECLSAHPDLVCGGLLRSSPVLYGALRLAVALLTWMQVLSDVSSEHLLQPWVASYPLVAAWEEHCSQSSAQQSRLSRLVSFFFNYLLILLFAAVTVIVLTNWNRNLSRVSQSLQLYQ